MSRPDDVPEDVMATAEERYLDAIVMTSEDEPKAIVLMIARAILAEREAQKQRDAMIADNHGLEGGSDFCQGCGEEIAAAIREGTP